MQATGQFRMSSAPRFIPRYTVADYHLWQGDWELIDGIPVAMTPSPFGPHERVVANLVHAFMNEFARHGCDCRVYARLDWIVSEDTMVRPDVMVVRGEQPERHLERSPELLVEVLSASTEARDRTTKREIYFEHGVSTYLIVDTETNQIELLRRGKKEFESELIAQPFQLSLTSGCCIELNRQDLFR
jgi:Uma2 family endonuclease